MNKNTKKARSGEATPERTETGAGARQTATSVADSITAGAGRQMRIADFLGYGPDRGQTLSDLRRVTDLDARTIRLMIRRERMSGNLIISDNKSGYYLTDSPTEAQRFVCSMKNRAAQIRQTATAVEKAAGLTQHEPQQIEGQEVLF